MDKLKEAKILKSVIERVESGKESILIRAWFNPVLWLVCVIIFFYLFELYERFSQPLILVVCSAVVGSGIGAVFIIQISEKTWPIVKNHISTESIERRIDEINT